MISDAIDRSVQSLNLRPLAGQTVFLDDSKLADVVDRYYLVSTLRQHLLATGCVLKDEREAADFIVEARAGAVGTDRSDLLFGIPATNVPQILPFQTMPAAIPEVPLAKRRDQRGIAKISLFAYHQPSGQPVWQSGLAIQESSSNDVWIFGAGPFQNGTIHEGPLFAGRTIDPDLEEESSPNRRSGVNLAQEATFASPARLAEQFHRLPPAASVAETPPVQEPLTAPRPAAPLRGLANDMVAPASYAAGTDESESFLPELERTKSNDGRPTMTARIYESPLRINPRNKTAQSAPFEMPSVVPLPLPQPRFDSM